MAPATVRARIKSETIPVTNVMNELPTQNEAKIVMKKKKNPGKPPVRPTDQKVVVDKTRARIIRRGIETRV
ncbi:hypothetical protein ACOSQ4_030213 [Xanthoceras sorbifolium]